MTIERAYYHKLMLEVGLTESFDRELDELLEREDPLSDLVLALTTCGGDRNEQIHILNEFVLSVPREQIDKDAVLSMVANDFLSRYEKDSDDLEKTLRQMHTVANASGFDADDPWASMDTLYYLYDDIERGWTTEAKLRQALVKLLRDKASVFEPPRSQPPQHKRSIAERLARFFSYRRNRKNLSQDELPRTASRPGKLFQPRLSRRGTAYFEFQYCKTVGSVKKILNSHQFWLPDSLVVYIDDQERLMEAYLPFLEHPESPDGSSTFCYFGINYYTKERTAQMLEQIKADKPVDWDILIPWLEKAATVYNGFYFLGI